MIVRHFKKYKIKSHQRKKLLLIYGNDQKLDLLVQNLLSFLGELNHHSKIKLLFHLI